MNFVQKLKCTFKPNYEAYYQQFSTEQLLAKKRQLKKHTVATALMWAAAILIMALANVAPELIILFSGVAGSSAIGVSDDYKRRARAINQIIQNRQ